MKRILARLWANQLLRYGVFLFLLFGIFQWVKFSLLQSLTLVALAGIVCEVHRTVNARLSTAEIFSPYRVVILPKFDELLLDFKLLTSSEQLEALHSLWNKRQQRMFISYTVLREQNEFGSWVIYSDKDKCFLSKVNNQSEVG